LPSTLDELSYWKEKIEILCENIRYFIEEDLDVVKSLNIYDLFEETVLQSKGQKHPVKVLEQYIKEIEQKYTQVQVEQPIAKNKEIEFKEASIKRIQEAYKIISPLINPDYVEEVNLLDPSFIGLPRYDILKRGAFANNQDISYVGSASITAQGVALEMLYYFTVSFASLAITKYSVYDDDVFKAIDKLSIFNKNEYVIVSIGVGIAHMKAFNNPDKLIENGSTYCYDGIEIVEIGYSQADIVNSSLFVLKRKDFPSLTKHELNQEIIAKYKFELIDDEYKIYAKIINLNEDQNLQKEISQTYSGTENLSMSVLSCVGIKYELRWRKGSIATQIQVFNSFQQNGNTSEINSIVPISD
jgi:hypothetical protein